MDNIKTFKIENGDLVFDDTCNLMLIDGVDEIAQSIERILTTNIREWFLNIDFGLDYSKIKGKGKSKESIKLAVREAVFQDDRVEEIEFQKVEINTKQRSLNIVFNIVLDGETIEGIEVSI